jgi:hypothetical protein
VRRRVRGERPNSVAHGVENPVFAYCVDDSGTFPEGENGWVDTRQGERCALRLQLVLDLDQDVGAIRVRQVDGLGIDDDANWRLLFPHELVQTFAEPVQALLMRPWCAS